MLKQQKGITLIALVITIVILIILAGVAISLTLSDNGLFNRTKNAVNEYKRAEANETGLGDQISNFIDQHTNSEANPEE